MSFPESWLPILWDNVLFYRTLDEKDRAKLRADTHALVSRLLWEGCRGQEITDEVKVTIAGQASLLLLGLDDYQFDELRTVLVYPGSFLSTDEDDEEGSWTDVLLGEAAEDGPVALSWWHSRWAGRQLGTDNVVIHEFAHKLAELGDADLGRPPFATVNAKQWKKVMNAGRRRLEEADAVGEVTLLNPTASEDLAEFFAYASETFFLQPGELRSDMPAVYNLLSSCYRQDPTLRPVSPELRALSEGAMQEYDQHAVKEYTTAIRRHPEVAKFYIARSSHLADLGDREAALTDLREAERLAGNRDERIQALCLQANLLYELDREEEGIRAEEKAERLLG